MRVSKKAQYAIRAVLAIARRPQGKPVQIGELSESESIPVKFLEQILLSLKKAGLLRSKRGAGGGYFLDRTPNGISLREILEWVDGPFNPLGEDDASRSAGSVAVSRCFDELRELVDGHLAAHTIQDLLEMERPEDAMAFEI